MAEPLLCINNSQCKRHMAGWALNKSVEWKISFIMQCALCADTHVGPQM